MRDTHPALLCLDRERNLNPTQGGYPARAVASLVSRHWCHARRRINAGKTNTEVGTWKFELVLAEYRYSTSRRPRPPSAALALLS